MQIIKYSLGYFLLVFSAGFVLGTLRVLFIEPQWGLRAAELLEMPIMLLVIFFSAKFIVSKIHPLLAHKYYVYIGVFALLYLLAVEFTLVLGLRGLSLAQYFASRDPISGMAYLLALLIYMVMPWVIIKMKR